MSLMNSKNAKAGGGRHPFAGFFAFYIFERK